MKSRAWWSVVAVLACAERPPELPEGTFDVNGAWTAYFWTDAGQQKALNSHLDLASISALEPTSTGYRAIDGSASSSGTFRIAGLSLSRPLYYLKFNQRFSPFPAEGIAIWELAREVNRPEFRWDIAGRSDVVLGSEGTGLRLDVDGLEPWVAGSSGLTLSSAAASLVAPVLGYGRGEAGDGATTATNVLVSWVDQPLLAGDVAYLHQLAPRTVPGTALTYQAATRYATLTQLALVDRAENVVAASLVQASASGSVVLDVPVTTWEQLRGDISPSARSADVRFFVSANPYGAAAPAPLVRRSGTPDLVRMKLPPGADVSRLQVEWARFYDAAWREIAIVQLDAPVHVAVDGGLPLDLRGFAMWTHAIAGADLGSIVPEIGPPLSPTINGRSLFDDGLRSVSVGTTPVIAWSRPRLGTATRYVLEIYELSRDPTNATQASLVLTVTLSSERFRVPNEILSAGRSYVASIVARSAPYDGPAYLGRQAFPFAAANCVSAVFVP